ncbi:hypothetical protein [Peptostreptococcus sp. MV1]|uniref:hypothetical protein n=1 Tax=Peptostreptococcus sp. MV1 TaxID=1219626 RepID=UPI00068D6AF8|nr:hypothetical protein [Peptostreptococcus sp. MV1]
MKKKFLTMVMVVAGIASIGGIGLAINAGHSQDALTAKNDTMYAHVETPLADQENTVEESVKDNNTNPIGKEENLTINEIQPEAKDVSQNIDKVNNRDIVVNETSKNINRKSNLPANKVIVKNKVAVSIEQANTEQANNEENLNKNVDLNANKPAQPSLSKEDALNLLKEKNDKVDYSYMGDEETYSVLKEKGHQGYVFLPDIQTDLGMFVNKNTREVYYFHPSGYMDIY